jgi:hypothetical protein
LNFKKTFSGEKKFLGLGALVLKAFGVILVAAILEVRGAARLFLTSVTILLVMQYTWELGKAKLVGQPSSANQLSWKF